MILHLDPSIPDALLAEEAKSSYAQYHKSTDHYVYVLDASYKQVPEALKAYVRSSFVMENNCQLSSSQYKARVSPVEVAPDLYLDEKHTLMIAGPCSVESEEQIETTAAHLQALGLRFLRAGSYKPRTAPYSFQGLGKEGLKLLAQVRKTYGLRIITEARDATHIDEVLTYSDIIQIGSKAMFDQGILRACAKSQKPILIKRGFGASLQEFIQASEFILCEGNTKVILCERGIRSFEQKTRFTLDLCGVAYLKQHTHLPVFVDPSHAMGYAYGVADLSRAAIAMGIEGLLIEVHPHPSEALSDSAQQLDLKAFSRLHATLSPIASAIGRQII